MFSRADVFSLVTPGINKNTGPDQPKIGRVFVVPTRVLLRYWYGKEDLSRKVDYRNETSTVGTGPRLTAEMVVLF